MKPLHYLLLLFILTGCRLTTEDQLPTLAVLPTLTPPPATEPLPRQLAFWQVVEGTFTAPEQSDQWQFMGRAGDSIALNTLGAINLLLQSPDGRTLGTGARIELTLPDDGDYVVLVRPVDGQGGRYQLELVYTDRPNPAEFTATPPPLTVGVPTPTPVFADLGLFISQLTSGETYAGEFIDSPVQPHVYTFEGSAGEYLNIEMIRISGTVDPMLALYDPEGQPLAVDDNSGGGRSALLRNVPLRRAGTYSIRVTGDNASGAYQIALTVEARPVPVTPTIIAPPTATPFVETLTSALPATTIPNQPLEPQVSVAASLLRTGDVNRHQMIVTEGEVVSIGVRRLQPESSLIPAFEVYDPAGERVGSANSRDGFALLSLLNISLSGTYSIFVTGEGGSSGDYVISYGQGASYEDVQRGPAVADTPYDGQITRRGVRDSWTLVLSAGDVISIAASPTNTALDPVIELVGPDGRLIASDDNSGGFPNALVEQVTAPISGVYRLYVSGSSGSTAGPYRLIWRYITVGPTPTFDPPRILLFTVEDEVAQGQYAFYPFQGTAGQRVRIRVIGQVASGFDPVAALIGPDGGVIAEGDDEGGGLNPRFEAELPADGTYQVRVNGYLSGGPFDLIVERLF